MDNDLVDEWVYMDILNHTRKYVHISTLFNLGWGDGNSAEICSRAGRGRETDPDKPATYALAKPHYRSLRDSSVRSMP